MSAATPHLSTDTTELLPCPFCAGTAEPWDANHTSVQGFEIVCTNRKCGASTGLFPTKPMAVRTWNTRTAAQAAPDIKLAELADKIERGEGLWNLVPGQGQVALGIRDTAKIITALRVAAAPQPASNAYTRANLLIQQLAWYYRVNDCADRHEDDALEVPLLDLRAAFEIARELRLPDGPALPSTHQKTGG